MKLDGVQIVVILRIQSHGVLEQALFIVEVAGIELQQLEQPTLGLGLHLIM